MTVSNHLKLAYDKLDPNNLEEGLPGREHHCSELYNFLFDRLKIRQTTEAKKALIQAGQVALIKDRHCNKTMFICGVPGIGKTVTVDSVIHKLEKLLKQKKPPIHKFQSVFVNGQHLTQPERVYSQILKELTGETCAPDKAQEKLDRIFRDDDFEEKNDNDDDSDADNVPRRRKSTRTPKKTPRKKKFSKPDGYTVVVIDELDLLFSEKKSQSVLYSLFDWPTSYESKMILITIANAMDLPERFMMRGKIASRMGWERLVFEPYTSQNLENILKCRLGDTLMNKCFEKAAIAVATRRVGRTTGDARRILDTCRRAIEIATEDKVSKIGPALINLVGFQNIDIQRNEYIINCSPMKLMILKSILLEADSIGEENIVACGVFKQLDRILSNTPGFEGYIIGPEEFQRALNILASESMINVEHAKCWIKKRLFLTDSSQEIRDLIKETSVSSLK